MPKIKQCIHCKERFKDEKKHKRHVRDYHTKTPTIYIYTEQGQKEKKIERDEKGKLACFLCSKKYVNRKQLQRHHKNNHNTKKPIKKEAAKQQVI